MISLHCSGIPSTPQRPESFSNASKSYKWVQKRSLKLFWLRSNVASLIGASWSRARCSWPGQGLGMRGALRSLPTLMILGSLICSLHSKASGSQMDFWFSRCNPCCLLRFKLKPELKITKKIDHCLVTEAQSEFFSASLSVVMMTGSKLVSATEHGSFPTQVIQEDH